MYPVIVAPEVLLFVTFTETESVPLPGFWMSNVIWLFVDPAPGFTVAAPGVTVSEAVKPTVTETWPVASVYVFPLASVYDAVATFVIVVPSVV